MVSFRDALDDISTVPGLSTSSNAAAGAGGPSATMSSGAHAQQHIQETSAVDERDLEATQTPGYRPGQARALDELANLDAEDESLQRWKASLGIVPGAAGPAGSAGGSLLKPEVKVLALRLTSPSLSTPIVLDLSRPEKVAALKKHSEVVIKEGAEYAVEIDFVVSGGLCSGLKYLQVAKRGPFSDKIEQMVGSYGPSPTTVTKKFPSEEAPSGMMARGTYNVRSRVIDDDKTIHLDFEWQFKIAKDW